MNKYKDALYETLKKYYHDAYNLSYEEGRSADISLISIVEDDMAFLTTTLDSDLERGLFQRSAMMADTCGKVLLTELTNRFFEELKEQS